MSIDSEERKRRMASSRPANEAARTLPAFCIYPSNLLLWRGEEVTPAASKLIAWPERRKMVRTDEKGENKKIKEFFI